MIEYRQGDHLYTFSYQECRERYGALCAMSDAEFLRHLPQALHLACYICWVKEIPAQVCLADDGIIHELVHALEFGTIDQGGGISITTRQLRKQFREQLRLSL